MRTTGAVAGPGGAGRAGRSGRAVPTGTSGHGARRGGAALALAGALLAVGACSADAATGVPERPAGNVLDAAEVLSPDEERALDDVITASNRAADDARVAVLTVGAPDGDLEEWSREVATAWGVGDAGADNGVLVVVATDDRELRVEVADGVRQRLTDAEAAYVVDEVLTPPLSDERYAEGLTAAVEEIYALAATEGSTVQDEPTNWLAVGGWAAGIGLVLGGLLSWVLVDRRSRRRLADTELHAAESQPGFGLTDEQREAYRRYRYHHRKGDAVSDPRAWLPLYVANPALYSGASGSSSSGGSSFGGGGGFSGGGASGGY
ncbi:TPM domain-containing protein [Cellulomonas endophytica]|uniref:TPM domain-containing protein n=1 Tax=Cellulomonas endophytica TaxID=2494735 RepID=UPI001010ACD7|nr:TPM domain-containing protein [Cellulomonas endophytica]